MELSKSAGDQGKDQQGVVRTKERIVILGTGWGAASLLRQIDTEQFDVTVISPRNYFLFTPMLAGATVGTVEYRSITLPIRSINPAAKYLEAMATDIDPVTRTVNCVTADCAGSACEMTHFDVQYDRLIVAVGAQTSTFGVPGVREHCCFLKQVEDARKIRKAVVDLFEKASLPDLSDGDRRKILTFAIIGAGPSGVEFASELRDFIEEDGPKYYPELIRHASIQIFEHSRTILKPFDKKLQESALRQITSESDIRKPKAMAFLPEHFKLTTVNLGKGVKEVKENLLVLDDGTEVNYGLCLWAAGNGPLPITLQLIEAIGTPQEELQDLARGRVAVDPWLRALGGEGRILALGDCACASCKQAGQLPATAQVAGQQGEHLARLLSQCDIDAVNEEGTLLPPLKKKDRRNTLAETVTSFAMNDDEIGAPFQFHDLGILAYIGGENALAQLQVSPDAKTNIDLKGKLGFGIWQSVYLSKQASWKNRILIFIDWLKAQTFGRDITQL